MKKFIKSTLTLFICLSFLIGTQTNAITGAEYMTKPDWYKNLYNTFLSAEIKADAELRKSMVINGMTEVQWLEKRAHTINAVQRVIKTDNATTVSYRQSIKPEDQAIKSLVPDILESALTWQAQILFSLGKLAIDGIKFSVDSSNPNLNQNPPYFSLKPENTPAGVRLIRTYSGSLNIPQTGLNLTNLTDAVDYGGIVLRTAQCLAGSPCSSLPAAPAILYGYPFSANITFNETRYQRVPNSDFTSYSLEPYIVAVPTFEARAYFKTIQQASAYISSRFICSQPNYMANGSITSADCEAVLIKNINANYDSINYLVTNTKNNEYGSRITIYHSYYAVSTVSVDNSSLDYLSKNIESTAFNNLELTSKVPKSILAAHLNNLLLRASQLPDYKGLPYSPTNPILESQITDRGMTLRDLLGATTTETGELYISSDGKTEDPLVVQYVINNTCTGTNSCNTGGGTEIDLNAPSAKPPDLETIPTALAILSPLMNLIAPYSTFSVARPSTQCPTSSFDALGRQWVLDVHCGLFESIRGLLSAVMLTVFAVASFRIVMKA